MDSIINPLLLTTAIFLSPNVMGKTGQEADAAKAVMKATYKQTGMDKVTKNLEKKYISDDLRFYGGYLAVIAKMIQEKKISYEWRY